MHKWLAFARMLTLASILLLAAGCGARRDPVPGAGPAASQSPAVASPDPTAPATAATVAPSPPPPAESTLPDPGQLSREALANWLQKAANSGTGPLLDRLRALLGRWQIVASQAQEADLNGDGTPEVAVALNGAPGQNNPAGGLFVIYRKEGQYVVDQSLDRGDDNSTLVLLNALADLDGDGRPEVVWSSVGHGASTAYATAHVSRWTPGQIQQLPGGEIFLTDMMVKVEGQDLLLSGGTAGSAGAGMAQRTRTDRYRWVNGALTLVDRAFVPSDFGYHKLQDGMVAEQFHRTLDAHTAYEQAMEPGRIALPADYLDASEPGQPEAFAEAVRAFARFRLGALLLADPATAADGKKALQAASGPFAGISQALLSEPTISQGCTVATTWALQHPDFLNAIDSPFGYATPRWQGSDLCGPLPMPRF